MQMFFFFLSQSHCHVAWKPGCKSFVLFCFFFTISWQAWGVCCIGFDGWCDMFGLKKAWSVLSVTLWRWSNSSSIFGCFFFRHAYEKNLATAKRLWSGGTVNTVQYITVKIPVALYHRGSKKAFVSACIMCRMLSVWDAFYPIALCVCLCVRGCQKTVAALQKWLVLSKRYNIKSACCRMCPLLLSSFLHLYSPSSRLHHLHRLNEYNTGFTH